MFAFCLLVGYSFAKPATELSFKDGAFKISGAGQPMVFRPGRTTTGNPKLTLFKGSGKWVVWDQRGLTIRAGNSSVSSFLPEISTTPKLFDHEQLLANSTLIKLGKRSKHPSGISGWELVDSNLYLLVRWEDQAKQPWLEALVRIDLDEPRPKAALVGKLEGLTIGPLDTSDRLTLRDGQLSALTIDSGTWGLATWDLAAGKAAFRKLGEGLASCTMAEGGRIVLFCERTSYGTHLVGRLDLASGNRKNLTEARGAVSFISLNPIVVRIDDATGTSLRTTDTGAELRLPKGLGISNTPKGILTWAPEGQPVRASLFSPKSWTALAVWRLEPQPAEAEPAKPRPLSEPSRSRLKPSKKPAAKAVRSRKQPKRSSKLATHRRR